MILSGTPLLVSCRAVLRASRITFANISKSNNPGILLLKMNLSAKTEFN